MCSIAARDHEYEEYRRNSGISMCFDVPVSPMPNLLENCSRLCRIICRLEVAARNHELGN